MVAADPPGAVEGAYPAQWEADVVLRDGSAAHLRPIRPEDQGGIAQLHGRLSEQSVYFRFFAPYPVLSARDLRRFTHLDHDQRAALVATVRGEIVGVVRWDRVAPGADEAEIAFTVRDDVQGLGLGSILLEHLASAARERGIRRFVADVLPANHRMLAVFHDAGYAPSAEVEDGVVRLDFAIEPTAQSRDVTESREHRAETRSIERLLTPESVAVVGASRDPESIGWAVLRHVTGSGFAGRVYAVNPRADEALQGVATYHRLTDAPEAVDLAVVVTPASEVQPVLADAAASGVHALVVISEGFAEAGQQGRERQRELVRSAHAAGMRVVGPNCLGVINTDPGVRLNASLSPLMPSRGRIGFFSQSGSFGIALLDTLVRRGLGVSTFVSAGNRADVSGNDLLQYWEEDEATDLVLLYLESIGNPRKFSRIARRTSRVKPIVAVKSGRSSQGIPLGHRVRASRLPTAAVDEMFRQAGVIQVDTLSEMFDVATVLTLQPLPAGRRVGVVGNSDALAVLTADACSRQGLEVAGPRFLPASATADAFGAELDAAAADPRVDALVVLFVPPVNGNGEAYVRRIAALSGVSGKPVVATVVSVEGMSDPPSQLNPGGTPVLGSVPTFGSAEDAVRALAAVTRYAEWRARPPGAIRPATDVDRDRARAIVAGSLPDARLPAEGAEVTLDGGALIELLGCYGIRVWPSRRVETVQEAARAAAELGYPVVLKSIDPTLVHRSDLGGVRLDLLDQATLEGAFDAMLEMFGDRVRQSLVVQQMAQHGVACVVGTDEDPLFGPIVWFGVGGVVTELVEDWGYAIPPLTDADAHELVRAPRAAALLLGHRGAPAVDTDELEDLVQRVAQLSDDIPEIRTLELNPVVVSAAGAAVLSAVARLARPPARTDPAERRLPSG